MTKKERRQLVEEFKEVFLTKGEARDLFLTKEDAVNFFVTKSEFNEFKGEMLSFKDEMGSFKDEMLGFKADYYDGQDLLVSTLQKIQDDLASHMALYKNHDRRIDHLEGAIFKS